MLELVAYIFFALLGVVFFALILPVKIHINAIGGTEEGFEILGRIMVFNGFAGGGVLYRKEASILSFYLFSWCLFSINIKQTGDNLSAKKKKKRVKKEKSVKAEKSLAISFKEYYNKFVKFKKYFKTIFRDLRKIIRVDMFSSYIKFGLGNPALTGNLIGLIYFINGFLPQKFVITPAWDFTGRVIQGELGAKITIRNHILWKSLICHLPLIISIIRGKKNRKQYSENTLIVQEV